MYGGGEDFFKIFFIYFRELFITAGHHALGDFDGNIERELGFLLSVNLGEGRYSSVYKSVGMYSTAENSTGH